MVPANDLEALPSSILLIDGIFLHRPELLAYWDASVFLRTDFSVSVARCAARDGSSPDPAAPSNRRYVDGQQLYLRSCQPEAKATIVIDYISVIVAMLTSCSSVGITAAELRPCE
jgi:uridine kinase